VRHTMRLVAWSAKLNMAALLDGNPVRGMCQTNALKLTFTQGRRAGQERQSDLVTELRMHATAEACHPFQSRTRIPWALDCVQITPPLHNHILDYSDPPPSPQKNRETNTPNTPGQRWPMLGQHPLWPGSQAGWRQAPRKAHTAGPLGGRCAWHPVIEPGISGWVLFGRCDLSRRRIDRWGYGAQMASVLPTRVWHWDGQGCHAPINRDCPAVSGAGHIVVLLVAN
jgi:hypothetical protein